LQSEFIIIACDGIWDVLEDQEAVDMVRAYLGAHPVLPPTAGKDLAHVLIEASLSKGSSDNVTACVVLL
jgi:serine/threonine protein phosphatase PrpC